MKKSLLTLAIAALAMPAFAQFEGNTDMGALPLGEKFTLKKGEMYTFSPSSNGVLTIAFEGEWPEAGLVYSNLYNSDFNPEMEMLQLMTSNSNPAFGQQSPAEFQILKYQPAASGVPESEVRYYVIGPDQPNLLEPSKPLDQIAITCTFTAADMDTELTPVVAPAPGETLGYYEVDNLSIRFTPKTFGVTCGSIVVKLYSDGELKETLTEGERSKGLEMTWEYNSSEDFYYINLQNLLLYKLADSEIDEFTIELSDFNYKVAGTEDGVLSLSYYYDQSHGMIVYESCTELPVITPFPEEGTTLTLSYSAELSSNGGEVNLLGTSLGSVSEEPSARVNVYEPKFSVSGYNVVIDFSDFKQTGPVNDSGAVVTTEGIRTTGSVMSLVVKGLMGKDGSIVEPVLLHLNWMAQSSGVEIVEAVEGDAVLYNLQGLPVSNPTPGIFIQVSGGKTRKVIL